MTTMPVREVRDRRGRAQRGSAGLLDREVVLEELEMVLDQASGGVGAALLIEGHAGIGKTRLHEAALDLARAREMRVLRGAGAELEANLAFGVARQLLAAVLAELPPTRRDTLLASAPDSVRALAGLIGEPGARSGGSDLTLSHGLFTVLATADADRPTLLAIDDLHWADAASLEFVLYLLNRLAELPLTLVMTRRAGMGGPVGDVLDRIATHPSVAILSLAPLGSHAVALLADRALGPRADRALATACQQATGGNPFYLHELLVALRDERELSGAALAQRALELVPDAVTRTLRVRVGRLGPSAAALARAVAILGDDVPLRHAALLAGLDLSPAAAVADALAGVEILLAREPLRFVHPLVLHAIADDIPASERASRHLDAARLVYADGADAERVAAHLMVGRAEGDRWVVELLRAAAADAQARGAPRSAVGYLSRALEEPPTRDDRTELLADLGEAEAAAGLPEAAAHLEAAATRCRNPRRRAELALARGQALYAQGHHEQAAAAYEHGIADIRADSRERSELELHDALQTGFVATGLMIPALQERAAERSARLLERAGSGPPTQGQRMLLAQAAVRSVLAGEPADVVISLAERAWDDGRLLEQETAVGMGWSLVTAALTFSGELERSIAVADAVLEDARTQGSPLAFATASYCRSAPYLLQGRVSDALADLELALDARRYGWRQFTRAATAICCLCQIERGELERADELLTEEGPIRQPPDLEDILRLSARAELRLAQGRPVEALESAVATGRAIGQTMQVVDGAPWRSTAALAALLLPEREQAHELARQDLEIAERTDVRHARIRAFRVFGLVAEHGFESLRFAAELGEGSPPRLETIRALIEFGASLRRENRRTAAREPLQRAADLAFRGGASVLHERARTELAATGARPRRDALLSGVASLTPSERRIADLAAAGQSNRQIAQGLFVTPKTVEYHLRNAYRKLDIEGRGGLARALGGSD